MVSIRSIRCLLLLFSLPLLLSKVTSVRGMAAAAVASGEKTFRPGFDMNVHPSNIHAVLVSTSRYWFNYRHAINALGMYELFRKNGIPDENIILSTYRERVRATKFS